MDGKTGRRVISFLLTILFIFELIPVSAFAADETGAQTEENSEEISDPEEGEDGLSDAEEGIGYSDDDIIVEEYANNIASSEKAEIVEELHGKRDEFQKEFIMENGMHLVTVYPLPGFGGKREQPEVCKVLFF